MDILANCKNVSISEILCKRFRNSLQKMDLLIHDWQVTLARKESLKIIKKKLPKMRSKDIFATSASVFFRLKNCPVGKFINKHSRLEFDGSLQHFVLELKTKNTKAKCF